MFIELDLKLTIPLHPMQLNGDFNDQLIQTANMLNYCKYFYQKGIFILAKKVIAHGEPVVLQQNSQVQVETLFKIIFFRPFVNEVINCQIIDDDETCIKCSTSFFNNIIVKNEDLFECTDYVIDDATVNNKNKNAPKFVYVWDFEGNKLYFDKFQNARCRVKAVKMDQDEMTIYATMDEAGLGLIQWW